MTTRRNCYSSNCRDAVSILKVNRYDLLNLDLGDVEEFFLCLGVLSDAKEVLDIHVE